jgi:thymidylate synthase
MLSDNDITIGSSSLVTAHSDEALVTTLELVLGEGHHLDTYPVHQPETAKGSTEIIGFQVAISDPHKRVLVNPARPFSVISAVARFVWMVSGSDRLEDIAFYEPKVRPFTDNQLSIPGSSYGMRLFQPRPGLNQLEGVVERLKSESGSRRSAAVIWCPEDAVRMSNDIPCAFGTFYHARNGRLIATTVMRSNNAFLLLPFNVFEFSLIAEMVAVSVGMELGSYVHFAASMHVYDSQRDPAQRVIDAYRTGMLNRNPPPSMDCIPADPPPLEQARKLAQLEAVLRHDHDALHAQNTADLLARGQAELHPYWLGFYRVLLAHALTKADRHETAIEIARALPHPFAESVMRQLQQTSPVWETPTEPLRLFPDPPGTEEPMMAHISALHDALKFGPQDELDTQAELHSVCAEIEQRTGRPVLRSEFLEIHKKLTAKGNDVWAAAARSSNNDATAGPTDRQRVHPAEVEAHLQNLRKEPSGGKRSLR